MATGDKLVNLDELKFVYDTINAGVYSKNQVDQKISQSAADVIDDIATRINITGADDTWSEIYSKLSLLPNRGLATIFIMNTTASSLLTGGKLTIMMAGIVVQANTGTYEFMMKHVNGSSIYLWRIEGLTSADATPTIRTVHRFTGTEI